MKRSAKSPTAVCLVSGGLDSAVLAAWATARYRCAFLHIDYGQRTAVREARTFRALARHFGIPADRVRLLRLPWLGQFGGSALTDRRQAIPAFHATSTGIPSTYVPFRNSILLAAAVAWAETLGASRILIGAVAADAGGYPDCRPDYFRAYNEVVRQGTRRGTIRVSAPLVKLDKTGVVRLGKKLRAPFQLTWSCYRPGQKPCGKCESCALRAQGFAAAGVPDPLIIKTDFTAKTPRKPPSLAKKKFKPD